VSRQFAKHGSLHLCKVLVIAKLVRDRKGETMTTVLIVILVLMLLGAIPTWPHSRSWGYGPSGGLGLVLLILLILLLAGRL
jgi:hypothetical protein